MDIIGTEAVKIGSVKPNPDNPRTIKDDKFAKLVQSIKDFPQMLQLRPIVVNDDMVVLGGNMRLKACKEAGLKEVPIIKASQLTAEQQKEFIIKDNVGFGEWDWETLANEWDAEQLTEWGLDIPGFDVAGEVEEDDFDTTPPAEPITALGDLYELNEHRVQCADSCDSDAVAKTFNGAVPDLVFTDPPYGVKAVGKNGKIGADNLAKNGVYAEIIGDDTTDTAKDFYQTCQSFGIINYILWGGNYFTDFLPPKPCWIIWDKRGDMNGNNFADGEAAWTSFNSPLRIKKQVWSGMIKEGESGKRMHPTQKPVKLCAELIEEHAESAVFDGFLGSGSTLIGCEEVGKTCYGQELSPNYCDVIVRRWVKYMAENNKPYTVKRNGQDITKEEWLTAQ